MVGLVSALRVLGGGLHNFGFTVFFLPISHDLGLNRAETSLAFSLARAQGAIEGPFVGYFIDRFGPRPMILIATLLTGLGYIALGWVQSYTAFLIVYLGLISLSFTPGFVHAPMAVGNSWFIRWRARAMTVISSAVPIGGTLITPLLAMAVQTWGWRRALPRRQFVRSYWYTARRRRSFDPGEHRPTARRRSCGCFASQ